MSKTSLIDELFDAIQPGMPQGINQMREILVKNPGLANMRSDPGKRHTDMTAQTLLERKMYGYLLTQDVLQYLRDRDIEIVDKLSQTPLHVACLLGNVEAVQLLLEQPGIDLNVENGSEETPLSVACRAAQLTIASLLLEKSDSLTEPDRRIHVNQEDDASNTPLEYLVCRGIYPKWTHDPPDEDLAALVKSMISASKQDSTTSIIGFQQSCMKVASELRSSWLLKVMLEIAPETKDLQVDGDGWRPLHFAIARGDLGAVEILLEADADTLEGAGRLDAVDFAITCWEHDIAEMIKSFKLSKEEQPQDLIGRITSAKIMKKALGFDELSVRELIQSFGKAKNRAAQDPKKTVWCHFLANDVSGPVGSHDLRLWKNC